MYPDSVRNPQSFYLVDEDPARFDLVDGGSGRLTQNNSTKVFTISTPGPQPVIQIYTSAGYRSTQVETNHGNAAARGFMMTSKDWRNVECTVYVRLSSNSTARNGVMWMARGGATTNKSQGNCESCGYLGYLRYDGNALFSKIQHFGSISNAPGKSVTSDLEDRWVGFKFCCYNAKNTADTNVNLELWIDENEKNSWKKVLSYSDNGNWGNFGTHCGGITEDQIISWGGPVVSLTINNPELIQFKKLSVREIDFGGVINEGGSNSGGGQGNGGTGSTGSGGAGGTGSNGTGGVSRCTSTQTNQKTSTNTNTRSNSGNNTLDNDGNNISDTSGSVENSRPNSAATNNNSNTGVGGGNVDRFGVQSAYARGQIKYDWKENFKSNGSFRWDFTGLGTSFASCEIIGYFGHHDTDDEVAGKSFEVKNFNRARWAAGVILMVQNQNAMILV